MDISATKLYQERLSQHKTPHLRLGIYEQVLTTVNSTRLYDSLVLLRTHLHKAACNPASRNDAPAEYERLSRCHCNLQVVQVGEKKGSPVELFLMRKVFILPSISG
jgi:hypothetical protein